MSLVLVVGGIRSGKSEVAERIAGEHGRPVLYIGTAPASDAEMAERIARHRARRPPAWRTSETIDPGKALAAAEHETVLVDGIGGWIAELMSAEGLWTDEAVTPLGRKGERARSHAVDRVRAFAEVAAARAGLTIVVAEESGLGLVPEGAAARRYLDLVGEAAQILGKLADSIRLVVAGHAIELKESRPQLVPPELRLHGDAIANPGGLDFAVNVVPDGPPQWLRNELVAALDGVARYPDELTAVKAIADRHERNPGEVLPLNGSADAFWLVAGTLRPRRAVVVHPSFTEAEVALRAMGRAVERTFRDPECFALDPSDVPADADLVFVCNPNNPTGTLDPADALEALARPGRVLVVDEAFMEFSLGEPESLASRGDIPGLLVVRSLTKIWSLPGIRAGYLLGDADVIASLRATRQPWSVNALALAALAACVRDEATPRKIAEEVAAAREELGALLGDLPGVRLWPSVANFLLLRVPDGSAVRAGLLERRIAVRRADTFPGLSPDHLRVAVRRPEENRALGAALREVLR